MKIIAYSYTNPLLESLPEPNLWGWELDKLFEPRMTESHAILASLTRA